MQQVKKRVESLAKMFGNTEYLEKMYYDSEELMSGVRHTVLLDQALEVVVSRATVIEKTSTMEALFSQEAKRQS
jgi:FKBP-type peptidyl-prolyl cis-trans isomerase (trigger factor)